MNSIQIAYRVFIYLSGSFFKLSVNYFNTDRFLCFNKNVMPFHLIPIPLSKSCEIENILNLKNKGSGKNLPFCFWIWNLLRRI